MVISSGVLLKFGKNLSLKGAYMRRQNTTVRLTELYDKRGKIKFPIIVVGRTLNMSHSQQVMSLVRNLTVKTLC